MTVLYLYVELKTPTLEYSVYIVPPELHQQALRLDWLKEVG